MLSDTRKGVIEAGAQLDCIIQEKVEQMIMKLSSSSSDFDSYFETQGFAVKPRYNPNRR